MNCQSARLRKSPRILAERIHPNNLVDGAELPELGRSSLSVPETEDSRAKS